MATENEERLMYERYIEPNIRTGATSAFSDPIGPTTSATPRSSFPIVNMLPFEQRLEILESKVTVIEGMLERKGMDISTELSSQLRENIVGKIDALLKAEYKGKFVAITYDRKIIASAETEIELMKVLEELRYPSDQIFLHRVGSRSVSGWI